MRLNSFGIVPGMYNLQLCKLLVLVVFVYRKDLFPASEWIGAINTRKVTNQCRRTLPPVASCGQQARRLVASPFTLH